MNSREIIREIVWHKRCPMRMGLNESFWDEDLSAWSGEGRIPSGVDPSDFFNFDIRFIKGSWINIRPFLNDEILEEDGKSRTVRNGWGAVRRYMKNDSSTPQNISFEMASPGVWREKFRERMLFPDKKRFNDFNALTINTANSLKSQRFSVFVNCGIFEQMRDAMGDTVMLEAMCMDPAWILDFCDVMTNFMIMHLEIMFREAGIPDGIWISEDMGYTHAPFISPELYAGLIMPFHKKLADFVHEYKIPVIMHACGNIRPLLPDICKAGIDALQGIEARCGQDIREFSAAVNNKMAFMGNMDAMTLETNDKEKIENEIIPKLEDIRKLRIPYVFGTDHSVSGLVGFDSYRYALELYGKYGIY